MADAYSSRNQDNIFKRAGRTIENLLALPFNGFLYVIFSFDASTKGFCDGAGYFFRGGVDYRENKSSKTENKDRASWTPPNDLFGTIM